MVYVSTSTNPVKSELGHVNKDIGRILMQSRRNNPMLKIGGVLYFNNNYYFQCLEGAQEDVDKTFKKIKKDSRHTKIETLSVNTVNTRKFTNWSMKYVAHKDNVIKFLHEKALTDYNPYAFDEEIITELINLFISEANTN